MTNLSLTFKNCPAVIYSLGILLASFLACLFFNQWIIAGGVFVAMMPLLSVIKHINQKQDSYADLSQQLDQTKSTLAELLKRIEYITVTCREASKGNLNHRIIGIDEESQTGVLEQSINQMLDLVEAYCKESFAATKAASRRIFFRKIIPTGLRGDFKLFAQSVNETIDLMAKKDRESLSFAEENVQKLVHSVTKASEQLNEYAEQVSGNAKIASQQVVTAAAGVEESSVNVQTVADTAVRMTARSQDISKKADESRNIAEDAKIKAQQTNQTVSQLTQAAEQISQVIEMIEMIAGQTNLLALNATIEAARAGDAGKGFAVVAEEVKNLSTRTKSATEDIRKKVVEIQTVAKQSVDAIVSICDTLISISEYSTIIAEGVGEQDTSIQQISVNLSEAALGARMIATAVEQTKIATNKTSDGSVSIATISRDLNGQANVLLKQVGRFIDQIQQTDTGKKNATNI